MATTLMQIRQQYPQYKDMSDQDLADALYKKHYSDMPRTAYDEKIGLDPAAMSTADIMAERRAGRPLRFDFSKPHVAEAFRRLGAIPAGAVQEARRFVGEPTPGYMSRAAQAYPLEAGVGRTAADIGATIPLTEGLGAVGGVVARGLTAAERYAKPIGTAIGRIIGQTGVGAEGAPPGERGIGAAIGGALGTAAEALPGSLQLGKSLTKRFLEKFSPEVASRAIMDNLPKTISTEGVLDNLGQGRDLEQNAKVAALKIKSMGKLKKGLSSERYQNVINKSGDDSIYDENIPTPKDSYKMVEQWKRSPLERYPSTMWKAHDDFTKIPTFGNAHKLQSVINRESWGTLTNPLANMQDKADARTFLGVRDRLINDMKKHLNSVDSTGNLAQKYQGAADFHRNEVIPYESKKFDDIVKGRVKNPKDITSRFKNPEANVEKVVTDIPSLQDHVIYNDLRSRAGKNPTADKLINAYNDLEKRGLKSYEPQNLESQIRNLYKTKAKESFLKRVGTKPTVERMIKAADKLEDTGEASNLPGNLREQLDELRLRHSKKGTMQKIAGGLAGGAVGRALGLPFLGEMASVGAGTLALPKLLKGVALPQAETATTSRFLQPAYKALTRGALPYYLAQRGR